MTRKPHLIVALALALVAVVSACEAAAPAPTSAGVQFTAPTVTPAPTSTAVQLNTPTVTPTPTPEPCLAACARVSAEDIGALQQLAQINKGRITDIAVSPDSAKLAVAVMAGVYIYDTATLEQLDFIADGSLMESVAFSPDGQDLAIGSYYQIHFYSAEGFEKRETLGGPFSAVSDLVYTADGKTLGALGGFRSAFLVDVGTKEYKTLEADGQVFSLAFSPAGDTAYVGTVSAIAVWDAATGEQTQLVEKSECTRSVYLADVPETASSALACDRAAQILEGESVVKSAQAAEGVGDALSVAGGPTNRVAIGRQDGQVEMWDASAMEAAWSVSGHALAVHSLAFMPDGEALFSATATEVKKWAFAPSAPLRAGDGMELGVIDGFSNNIQNFVFPPNGKPALSEAEGLLFVMGGKVWQLPPDQCFGQLSQAAEVMTLDESISYAALSPDGALVAVSGGSHEKQDYYVALFNLADGAEINRIELGKQFPGHGIVFSADGEFWAIALDQNVMILNRQGEPVDKASSNYWISSIAFSPDGKYLAATDGKGIVTVWEVGTWKVVNKITGVEDYTYSMEFSPDSSKVAIAYSSGKVIVVEISTGEIVLTLTGQVQAVYDMAFTPDGKILITASGDHTVKFWDAASGEEIYWLTLPGSVAQMKFSADGKLYLATYEGVIRVFGIPCAAIAASAQYPALNAGAQPTPTPAPVSPKCIIALDPPATYKLDGDFHVFGFPPGYSPVPKTTILWSNLKKATESNGRVTIWIPASRATVAVDPATNVITVAIPNCNLPYDK